MSGLIRTWPVIGSSKLMHAFEMNSLITYQWIMYCINPRGASIDTWSLIKVSCCTNPTHLGRKCIAARCRKSPEFSLHACLCHGDITFKHTVESTFSAKFVKLLFKLSLILYWFVCLHVKHVYQSVHRTLFQGVYDCVSGTVEVWMWSVTKLESIRSTHSTRTERSCSMCPPYYLMTNLTANMYVCICCMC